MFQLLLFALLGATFGNVVLNEPANRFLAVARTTTVVVLSTTTVPTTVKRNCWTSATANGGGVGPTLNACRKRRGIEEQPEIIGLDVPLTDILKPTQVVPLETTREAILEVVSEKNNETDNEASLQSSSEIEIQGVEDCLGRSALGVTLYHATSTTIIITSLSTVTSGVVTYTLATCFPSAVANDKC